jgi:hypothetical protein
LGETGVARLGERPDSAVTKVTRGFESHPTYECPTRCLASLKRRTRHRLDCRPTVARAALMHAVKRKISVGDGAVCEDRGL